METIAAISVIVLDATIIVALLWCLWCLYCNEKTYQQRSIMLESIDLKCKEWQKEVILMREYNQVPYRKHHHELIWFRDPLKYYPEELQKRVRDREKLERLFGA